MNQIPGSGAIGYGFNALGAYGPESLVSQVFAAAYVKGKTFTFTPTQIEYSVPDNVNVIEYTPLQGGTKVFQRQYDLQSYLSANAQITGGYNAFSGHVAASYKSAMEEWGSCFYALTDAWVGMWTLVMANADPSLLDPAFSTALNSLPAVCDVDHRRIFFEFFKNHGTHYVHGVGVGGYFAYYEGVENMGTYSEQQVSANVALEYQAVFVDVSAQSSLDWSRLGQQWVNSRSVSIAALGGNSQVLEAVAPVMGTNASESYSAWLKSVETNPSAVQFMLRPWHELLAAGSAQQAALQQALHLYMNYNIRATARYEREAAAGFADCVVAGEARSPDWMWPNNPDATVSGIQVVLISADTLDVTFSSKYFFNAARNNGAELFNQLMEDLNNYAGAVGQWCCCIVFNYPWMQLPAPKFIAWLGQFGIKGESWTDNYKNCANGQPSFNYVALGLWGGLSAQECFAFNEKDVDTVTELSVNPLLVDAPSEDARLEGASIPAASAG